MSAAFDDADHAFLARLNRRGECTVHDLCDDLNVTATAVRQRLTRLMSAGLVARETASAGRGRPFHVYRVTGAGRRHLGDDYGELARLLWREMKQIEDAEIRTRLMSRLRDALVERYGAAHTEMSLGDRFRHLQRALDRQGFQVDVAERQRGDELLPVLREHNCPYHDLATEDSLICHLEQAVFEEVLGTPIALTQCCRDGHACCEFEPVTVNG
jgi:predicted ArsR family transcriptional regulator